MTLTRRKLLTGAAAFGALAPFATACASPVTANPGHLTLWYTSNGLSPTNLSRAVRRFSADRLVTSQVSNDLKTRLLAALAGRAYLPDITMIGDDISSFYSDRDSFVDLNTLGARELAKDFLPWKWRSGGTPDGRFQMGIPIDVGPAALYYRHDIFEKAGFPSEPDDVAAAVSTWEKYFDFGERIQRKLPGRFLITDTKTVFSYSLAQESKKYFDQDNHYLDDQSGVRRAWDRALEAHRRRLTAGYAGSQTGNSQSVDEHAAWNSGKELSLVSASWRTGEMKQAAPGTKGRWRVCRPPGGAGNQGGSYLAVTKYCPRPEAAFEVIRWLQSPANQPQNYLDVGLFPSTPAATNDPRLLKPDPFFGGQVTMHVFASMAQQVKYAYFSPWDITISDMYTDELTNVELGGKDPDKAWHDARTTIERLLRRQGVLS